MNGARVLRAIDWVRLLLISVVVMCSLPKAAAAAATVDPSLVEEAKSLLRRYAELSATQSSLLLDLYSDKATIRLLLAATAATSTLIDGRSFKALMRESMLKGSAEADASNFHQGTVEQRGERLLVRARRYSANRCYWDDAYVVVLVREQSGWVILEETIATQMESRCSASQLATGVNGSRVGVAPLPGAAAHAFAPLPMLMPGGSPTLPGIASVSASVFASATVQASAPSLSRPPAQIRPYRDPNSGRGRIEAVAPATTSPIGALEVREP